MNNTTFSEKDSLELISQMLKQTKQNLQAGSGKTFLYNGYTGVALSFVISALVHTTSDPRWAALYFLMFMPGILIRMKEKRHKPEVVTYTDKAVYGIWEVIGTLFAVTAAALAGIRWMTGCPDFVAIMLPLSLLYCSIGTSMTGAILRIPALVRVPIPAFLTAICMLTVLSGQSNASPLNHLLFGLSMIFAMILPGHILNRKSEKTCSKN